MPGTEGGRHRRAGLLTGPFRVAFFPRGTHAEPSGGIRMRYSAFAWLMAMLAPVAPAAAQGNSDPAQAAESYRQACDNGIADGCVHLGIAYAHGQGVAADPARAFQLYSRAAQLYAAACDGGNAHACNDLASLVIDGRGVPRDTVRAIQLYARACQLDPTSNASCEPARPGGH